MKKRLGSAGEGGGLTDLLIYHHQGREKIVLESAKQGDDIYRK